MANHKSAEKRSRQAKKRRLLNKSTISKIKTLTKRFLNLTDPTDAEKLFRELTGTIDRAAAKGRIHRNNAARRKSALAKRLNLILSQGQTPNQTQQA
jgi:small subunit ribosomal protein S20